MVKKKTLDLTKLTTAERRMVEEILVMKKTEVKKIIVPKNEMVAFAHNRKLSDVLGKYDAYHFSRYPVYCESYDNIVGILHTKDIISFWHHYRDASVIEFVRLPHFVYEDRSALDIFLELQHLRISLAVTIDEFGGISGIITIEDLIEEIVGDIEDEFDQRRKPYIEQLNDYEYILNTRMELDEFAKHFKLLIEEPDVSTVGGLILKNADRIPKVGETIQYRNLVFTILEGTRRKIIKARVRVEGER
ncbi:CBS domain-containing protein [candidate division WOR-3 bacterium]|nr:CBS domain-containing protein [candidate division WOR-3 bacterium]